MHEQPVSNRLLLPGGVALLVYSPACVAEASAVYLPSFLSLFVCPSPPRPFEMNNNSRSRSEERCNAHISSVFPSTFFAAAPLFVHAILWIFSPGEHVTRNVTDTAWQSWKIFDKLENPSTSLEVTVRNYLYPPPCDAVARSCCGRFVRQLNTSISL